MSWLLVRNHCEVGFRNLQRGEGVRIAMSEKKKSYGQRVEEAVGKGVPAPEIMQMMVVDYLKELANGKPLVTISDGDTTFQCVMNNPANEHPKQP